MCMQNCGITKKQFEESTETYNNMIANGIYLQVGDPVYDQFQRLKDLRIKYQTNHKARLT